MAILTVTSKGQVTLRKDILRHLGVHPGDRISIDMLPEGKIEGKMAPPAGRISDAFDFLKREGGVGLSTEQIGQVAADAWAGKR